MPDQRRSDPTTNLCRRSLSDPEHIDVAGPKAVGAEQALHSVGYLYESAGCDLCASLSRCCH